MIANQMMRDVGLWSSLSDEQRAAAVAYTGKEAFGGDMDDRAVLEAHGIDVDATPVDTFMNRGYGLCLSSED